MSSLGQLIRWALRLAFAITCVLAFSTLTLVNIYLTDRWFPGMSLAAEGAGRTPTGYVLRLVAAAPIPVAGCYVWYRVFRWLDRRLA